MERHSDRRFLTAFLIIRRNSFRTGGKDGYKADVG